MSTTFTHVITELTIFLHNLKNSSKIVSIDYTDELFKLNNRVTMFNVTDKEITMFPQSIVHLIKEKDLPADHVLATLKSTVLNQLTK